MKLSTGSTTCDRDRNPAAFSSVFMCTYVLFEYEYFVSVCCVPGYTAATSVYECLRMLCAGGNVPVRSQLQPFNGPIHRLTSRVVLRI